MPWWNTGAKFKYISPHSAFSCWVLFLEWLKSFYLFSSTSVLWPQNLFDSCDSNNIHWKKRKRTYYLLNTYYVSVTLTSIISFNWLNDMWCVLFLQKEKHGPREVKQRTQENKAIKWWSQKLVFPWVIAQKKKKKKSARADTEYALNSCLFFNWLKTILQYSRTDVCPTFCYLCHILSLL